MKTLTTIVTYPLLLFLLGGIFSCDTTQTNNEEAVQEDTMEMEDSDEMTTEEVKEIIERKNNQVIEWYREGNIDSAATVFHDDAIQMPPNTPAIIGIESFKDTWKKMVEQGTWNFELNTKEIKHSGNLAVELGSYTLDFEPNENSEIPAMDDKGNYVVLWEKRNGEWKITWDAPVSEKPITPPVEDQEE